MQVHTNLYKCDVSFFLFDTQLHVTVLPFKTLLVLLVMLPLTGLFLDLNAESDHILTLINISPLEDYKNVCVTLNRENIL